MSQNSVISSSDPFMCVFMILRLSSLISVNLYSSRKNMNEHSKSNFKFWVYFSFLGQWSQICSFINNCFLITETSIQWFDGNCFCLKLMHICCIQGHSGSNGEKFVHLFCLFYTFQAVRFCCNLFIFGDFFLLKMQKYTSMKNVFVVKTKTISESLSDSFFKTN